MILPRPNFFICVASFLGTFVSALGQTTASFTPTTAANPVISNSSWTDYENWSGNLVPGVATQPSNEPNNATAQSTLGYNVEIAAAPPGNPISLDTASATPTGATSPVLNYSTVKINNLDFSTTTSVSINTGVGENLSLTGNISNSSNISNTIGAGVVLTGTTSLLSGGTGAGQLNLSNTLSLQNTVTTIQGSVTVVGAIDNQNDVATANPSVSSVAVGTAGTTGALVVQANDSAATVGGTTGTFTGSFSVADGSLTLAPQQSTASGNSSPPIPAVGNVTLQSGPNSISGNGSVGNVVMAGNGNAITSNYSSALSGNLAAGTAAPQLNISGITVTGTGNTITGQLGGANSTTSGLLTVGSGMNGTNISVGTSTNAGSVTITGGVNALTIVAQSMSGVGGGTVTLTPGTTLGGRIPPQSALYLNGTGSQLNVAQDFNNDITSVAGLNLTAGSLINFTLLNSTTSPNTTNYILTDTNVSASVVRNSVTLSIASNAATPTNLSGLATGNYNLFQTTSAATGDFALAPGLNINFGSTGKSATLQQTVGTDGFTDVILDISGPGFTLTTSATSTTPNVIEAPTTVYHDSTTMGELASRVFAGQTVNLTTTLINTSASSALDYNGLGDLVNSSTNGNGVAGATMSGTVPASGAATNSGQTFSTAATGVSNIAPTATAMVSGTMNAVTQANTPTPITLDVVQNRVVTTKTTAAAPLDFGRALIVNGAINLSGKSVTFSSTDFDDQSTRVTLGGSPLSIAGNGAPGDSLIVTPTSPTYIFGGDATANYSTTTGAAVSNANVTAGIKTGVANVPLNLADSDQNLAGAAPSIAAINYTYDAVNERVVSVSGVGTSANPVPLGYLHSGAAISGSIMLTSMGLKDVTANATVADDLSTSNGVGLSSGTPTNSVVFDGTQDTQTATENLAGNITNTTSNLAVTGGFNLAVTDEFGTPNLPPVAVSYTAQVYTGQGVWASPVSGSWGAANAQNANWVALGGTPGLDPNFTDTDTAAFGGAVGAGTVATVNLNGDNPSLIGITFYPTSGGYVIAMGSGGSLTLNAGVDANNNPFSAYIYNESGNNEISAPIAINSPTFVTTTAGNSLTFSGVISSKDNTDALVFTGPGTSILSAANIYNGGTFLESGTLQISGVGTLGANSSPLEVDGGTLDLGNTSQTVGAVTFGGGNGTIQNGTLIATTDFNDNAGGGTTTINANLAGMGALNMNGSDLLALNGTNTYTGGTFINNGIVAAGNTAAFGVGNVTLSGGALMTGNGMHIIQVNGNYNQTGGTLVLSLTGTSPGASPGYEYLHATGVANLSGGALLVNFSAPYVPVAGDTFAFIQADGGITGDLASTATNLRSLDINLQGQGFIVTQLPFATLPGYSLSSNEKSTAQAIDQNYATGGASGDFQTLLGALNGLTATNISSTALPAALDQLTPERFLNFIDATAFNNAVFTTQEFDSQMHNRIGPDGSFAVVNTSLDSSGLALLDPSMDGSLAQVKQHLLAYSPSPQPNSGLQSDSPDPLYSGIASSTKVSAPPTPTRQFTAFIQGSAVLAQGYSQTEVPHSDATTAQGQIGGAFRITPQLNTGLTFAYGHTDGTLDTNGTKVTIDSFAPGVFLSYASKGWYANATGDYGIDDYTQDRHISFGGLSGIAHSDPSGEEYSANLDGGYDFHFRKLTYGPTLGLQYTHLTVDSYNESGFGPADLSVGHADADSLRSRVGGQASVPIQVGPFTLIPQFSASWQHEFLDEAETITSQLSSAGPAPFSIRTPAPSRDSALVSAGLDATINDFTTLYLNYAVQVGQENYFGQSATGGVRIVY